MNYQIWKLDGTSVARSPLLGKEDLPRPSDQVIGTRYYTFGHTAAHPVRAICLKVTPKIEVTHEGMEPNQGKGGPSETEASEEQAVLLVVTRDLSDIHTKLRDLSRSLLIAALGTVILSVLIGYLIVRQGLKPLKAIAGQIAAIGENDLSVRITASSVPLEIEPIQLRLNDLLNRLETAFQRERRFTADAAHELRTPLAGLRSILEVCLARPRDEEAYREAVCDSLAVSSEMQVMVETLLALARLEGKDVPLDHESIVLKDLVNTCWRPCSDKALDRDLAFDNQIDSGLTCLSDQTYLAMIFTNCLSNAVTYANPGGRIMVKASVESGETQIAFINTGCTLTQEELKQCFDPFWRADVSRSASGNHCGLGLTLVKRIVEILGGEAAASVSDQSEFHLMLHL